MSLENPQQNNEYEELFNKIKNESILPNPNQQETSQEKLQEILGLVFKEYGERIIEANDGKILTTLSGGLDSTIALAFLRKNFPDIQIETFTMGGDEQHPDVQHARIAAKKFESVHHEFLPTPDDIQEAFYEFKRMFPDVDVIKQHGQLDVFMLYQYIKKFNPKTIIVHDGIDELMGGYWTHRKETEPNKKAEIFVDLWKKVVPDHLEPLTRTANYFDISLLFPYLDSRVVSAISQIPLDKRTSKSQSKIPLKNIAQNIDVPQEIIDRPKRGQVGMLDREGEKSG
jgi:asparagine synthetase B (glutamine-hydrolysing)